MKKFKALVTGGAGFIGSHLVDSLVKSKNEVVVLDNFSSGKIKNLSNVSKNGSLTIIKGDILKIKDITDAMKGCNIVFHLGNVRSSIQKPLFNHEVNATGTLNTLEAARNLVSKDLFIALLQKFMETQVKNYWMKIKLIITQ